MGAELRIVSLIASSTEIVCALGLEDNLVGISHECDWPPGIKKLPVCTSFHFSPELPSPEIDREVRSLVERALSIYKVDPAMLDRLQPTHIITQSQCQVCAVSLSDVEAAVCQTVASQPSIVSLEPNALADIWQDITKVAHAVGMPSRGEILTRDLKARMDGLSRRALEQTMRPKVAFIEWIEPLMTGGNWMPELIEMAGGVNLFGRAGKHSPDLSWDALAQGNPDVIVVAPCGFDMVRTGQEMHFMSDRKEWKQLQAVREGRVFIADGNQFFNRPGPRVAESLQILCEILHPHEFEPALHETGWLRFWSS